MNKKLLKKIALFLLLIFTWSSAGLGQEISPAQIAQYKSLMNSQTSKSAPLNVPSLAGENKIAPAEEKLNQIKTIPGEALGSEIEEYFAKTISEEAEIYKFKPLQQFGYKIFRQTGAELSSGGDQPLVSADYMIGPGDSFIVTMWGIAEGVFDVQVNPEGNVILPKVGVVPVAGVRYGDLKSYIEKQLTRYYEQVNVAVAIKNIAGIRVYVVGEVNQPGTYNVSSLSTAYNALFMAGGPTKRGSLRDVRIIRGGKIIGHMDLYNFLLYGNRKQDVNLIAGDTVFVPIIGPVAAVAGNVRRAGIYEIKPGADLSDVITMAGGVLPTSYINRVQIERVVAHEKRAVLDKQFNFSEKNPRFYTDVKDMDLIKIYPIFSAVDNVVYLDGAVKYPGPYQWRSGLKVRDLLANAENLVIGAYLPRAEIVRTDRHNFESKIIEFGLGKLLSGDNKENYALEAGDRLVVSSELKLPKKISLKGEIRLSGDYTISKGDRLSSVIKRAGGFTDQAYLFGAIFKRKSARDVQTKSLNELVDQMETDLLIKEKNMSSLGLTDADLALKNQENARNRELVSRLKEKAEIEGRVIIALRDPGLFEGTKDDIELEDGDELMVPKISNVVNVLGEVYNPSSVVFQDNKSAAFYLAKVGGTTSQANSGEIYLIRADGSIVSRRQGYDIPATKLLPGDTILVPKSFERLDFWLAIKDFTHWFYEATLAFAVIATYIKK
ncbi:SLBB domain-containing protein [Candidatus Saganbacteria bacterium]|nr:SLBB domain-containing protein [Candidatus Saganbacteria bacterium]